jgi:hypothetical protein
MYSFVTLVGREGGVCYIVHEATLFIRFSNNPLIEGERVVRSCHEWVAHFERFGHEWSIPNVIQLQTLTAVGLCPTSGSSSAHAADALLTVMVSPGTKTGETWCSCCTSTEANARFWASSSLIRLCRTPISSLRPCTHKNMLTSRVAFWI